MSDSLQPHALQSTRLACPSLSPRVCSDSCPLSQLHHPTISFCHPLLLLTSIFPSIRVFSNELSLCIRWWKYWSFSFSISPSNEYSGLISFRIDCFDLLAVQGILKSLLQYHNSKASSLYFWSICIWAITEVSQLIYFYTSTWNVVCKSSHFFLPYGLDSSRSHILLCLF